MRGATLSPRPLVGVVLSQYWKAWKVALQQEVDKMLEKGAVEIVHNQVPIFYSILFLVEKTTGGWKSIVSLSSLNAYTAISDFKLETVTFALAAIQNEDFVLLIC